MIKDLELKINGELSVTREELFELVNSWGRSDSFATADQKKIEKCESNECYDLSNLDVSKIEDLSDLFCYTYYNGDLSKWDISNCKNLQYTFSNNEFFNNDSICNWNTSNIIDMAFCFCNSNFDQNLNNWNVSKVEDLSFMFYNSEFNGDVSSWDLFNCRNMNDMFSFSKFDGNISSWKLNNFTYYENIFYENQSFKDKYNDGENIPNYSKQFLKWFKDNKENMREMNLPKEEILDFFSFNEKEIEL